ncbi:MAG: hypothetical protein WCX23_01605 [Candidatus Paceibacterota bacterium]|jgi:hypothetical protein
MIYFLSEAFHFLASIFASMYIAALVSFLAILTLNRIVCTWSRNANIWEETGKYAEIFWFIMTIIFSMILMNFSPTVSYFLVGVIILIFLGCTVEEKIKKGH